MKNKNLKLLFLIIILIFSFCIFLFLVLKPYNYKKEYYINNFKIIEKYNKKEKYYNFFIVFEEKLYSYIIKDNYNRKRELIKDVYIFSNEKEQCILPISDYINFFPLCSNDTNIYTYNLSKVTDVTFTYNKPNELNDIYNNITVNSINGESFLLYNYKGFYFINENENLNLSLFLNDIYNLELVYQKDEYLIVFDYQKEYYTKKLYIINITNGKFKEMNFDYEISYDSFVIGDYKDSIYLVDKKEEREYKINIKKRKIEIVDYQIIQNNKLVKTSYKNLINNDNYDEENLYNYEIINNKLYLNIEDNYIQISNNDVNKIVKIINDTVYYLVNENLYMFNNTYGEVLLMKNFEWNFNNTNMIYIYK